MHRTRIQDGELFTEHSASSPLPVYPTERTSTAGDMHPSTQLALTCGRRGHGGVLGRGRRRGEGGGALDPSRGWQWAAATRAGGHACVCAACVRACVRACCVRESMSVCLNLGTSVPGYHGVSDSKSKPEEPVERHTPPRILMLLWAYHKCIDGTHGRSLVALLG